MDNILTIDIETIPNWEEAVQRRLAVPAACLLECPTDDMILARREQVEAEVRGQYVQEKTIQKHIQERMDAYLDLANWGAGARESWMERAALDPSRSRVLAVGLAWGGGEPELHFGDGSIADEADLLQICSSAIADAQVIIGHNVIGFDLHYLTQRARAHNRSVGKLLYKRLWSGPEWKLPTRIIDTMEVWRCSRYAGFNATTNVADAQSDGGGMGASLNAIARFLGLPCKTEPDGGGLFWTWDRLKQTRYLRHDVCLTRQVADELAPDLTWGIENRPPDLRRAEQQLELESYAALNTP